ncbi:MAG: SpoIIE family protein phosphatase [Crocinitomicaceae bacterium]|nr:SpoIIE family protein phosphatase [Crocinitomicaceae bacterium]
MAEDFKRIIIEDKTGNLWFGTWSGGVSKYDVNRASTHPCHLNTCKHDPRVRQDLENHQKELAKSFITYSTEHGLANTSVRSITEDKTGNLWFGTDGGGISKYDGNSFTIFSTEQGLAYNNVRSITEDKIGNLWFGTYGGGVSKYDGKSFTTYNTDQGLAHNIVLSIAKDKTGNIWFGTSGGGVSKYDGKYFTTYSTDQGLANNFVSSITEDKTGNLWFGTSEGGVSKYDGKSFTTYNTDLGLANNRVISSIEDKTGNLWFGTDGGGVSKYNGKTFTTYSTEQGLANNIVSSITEDKKGNIWFGTYGGGVSVLSEEFVGKTGKVTFLTLNISNGLPDNGVTGIVEDKAGNIIIGTNFGLGIIPLGDLDKGIEVYNQFTGYPVRDVNGGSNNGALFCDSRGIIWAGTGSDKTNLVRIEYGAIDKDNELPKVVIQKVSVKREDVCWYSLLENQKSADDSVVLAQQEAMIYGKLLLQVERDNLKQQFAGITFDGISRFYSLPENLVLPYKYNHISFDFLAIETDRNFLVNYQYILEGQDQDWSPITKKTDVTFNNLHEGDYTFLLKAQSPWGIWGAPIEYNFTVLPPWYRTWWSYTLYLTLFIYSIWSIVQIQTRKLKLRQKELQIEVDNATSELRLKNKEVEIQRDEILDSITYAKRIQNAILPPTRIVNEYLNDSFVIYKPKDIVAGDFYWMEQKEENVLFAVADCTGHGVPGALVSMVCNNALNRSVREYSITEPGKILDMARKIVIQEFEKSDEEVKDGMDIALCSLMGNKLNYAGAHNPLWVIRKGKLIETKANKQPIGRFDKPLPYTTHSFDLEKGDTIYLSSDGYAAQFGGEKGKKFRVKAFKALLLSIQDKSMEEQKKIIDEVFENWKGKLDQVDDVCIIGIRIA